MNMRLFEFGFRNDTDTENGVIFIVERELSKAIEWANSKLQKESYDYRVSEYDLIDDNLRLQGDETVGIYEVIYPNSR
jgi:hypothetical protein